MKLEFCNEETILEWKKNGEAIVCFGAGNLLRESSAKFDFVNNILYIMDNNCELWNRKFQLADRQIDIKSLDVPIEETNQKIRYLITTPYYLQIYNQLSSNEKWENMKEIYYYPSIKDLNFLRFKKENGNLKVEKKISFRSGNAVYVYGQDCNDNAKALFDYMIKNHYNEEYELVWFVHNPDEFSELQQIKNVKLVSYEWEKSDDYDKARIYFNELLTSQVIFFTVTWFWLRYCSENQLRVNLWHGCGFKDCKTKNRNADRNHDLWTVTSKMYIDIHAKEYGISKHKIVDTGLAKEDLLFAPPAIPLNELLNIPKAQKYIFWLPTFRTVTSGVEELYEYEIGSETGLPVVTTQEEAVKLNSLLEKLDIFLVIKLHPIQNNDDIKMPNLSRIRVITNREIFDKRLQINTLLSMADALISDYSSAAVDYLLLDRPIAFAMDDIERYEQSRGFVFDNIHEYLPGKEIYTFDEFIDFIEEVGNDIDSLAERRRKLSKVMHTHQDNNNCRRILEAVGIARED